MPTSRPLKIATNQIDGPRHDGSPVAKAASVGGLFHKTIVDRTGKRMLRKLFALLILLSTLTVAAIFLNSLQFSPDPSGDASFIGRAQHKFVAGIKVSVSALSASESRRSFGEDKSGTKVLFDGNDIIVEGLTLTPENFDSWLKASGLKKL